MSQVAPSPALPSLVPQSSKGRRASRPSATQMKHDEVREATDSDGPENTVHCRQATDDEEIRQATVLSRWSTRLKREGNVYEKTVKMHAKSVQNDGFIITNIDGVLKKSSCEKGDFVMIGSRDNRYPMKRCDFESRYDVSNPMPSTDPELAEDGYQLYSPIGKVWAHELTDSDVKKYFKRGVYQGRWGGVVTVSGTDYVAVPFPHGGEVYTIRKVLFEKTYIYHSQEVREEPEAAGRSQRFMCWRPSL